MRAYVAKRIASMLFVLFASSVVVFGFLHLAPGDPAVLLLAGRPINEQALDAVRTKYALNEPLPVQYLTWVTNIAHGDLGESIKAHDSVLNVIAPRMGTTFSLTAYAALLMLLLGIPLGVVGAVFRSGPVDVVSTAGALLLAAIPPYVSAVVLIAVFAVVLQWFPAFGVGRGASDTIYHLTLPAIALSLSSLALVSRVTRLSMIDALDVEYVETARIRGFSTPRVVLKHAFRSALVPVVTVSGVVMGYLLSGAILVEYAFGLNGMGALLVSSVQGLDYAVVQAIALVFAAEFLIINLVVDLLYAVIDPRIRLASQNG